nr:hypothetical protein CFP56_11529 [Quercus suber]
MCSVYVDLLSTQEVRGQQQQQHHHHPFNLPTRFPHASPLSPVVTTLDTSPRTNNHQSLLLRSTSAIYGYIPVRLLHSTAFALDLYPNPGRPTLAYRHLSHYSRTLSASKRLHSDADQDRLELGTLTSTFVFGRLSLSPLSPLPDSSDGHQY